MIQKNLFLMDLKKTLSIKINDYKKTEHFKLSDRKGLFQRNMKLRGHKRLIDISV